MTKFLKRSHLASVAGAALSLAALQPAFAQTPQGPQGAGAPTDQVTEASDVVVINGIGYRDARKKPRRCLFTTPTISSVSSR